ncbi:MAG TPA: AMP-binding protein [Anaeromyxobacteraceae bacterium]|nr:AMP-binding protein [Anaeromyxobacteraceae bacterium]
MNPTDRFLAARDFLQRHREDYEAARAGFRWPALERFNWALDWFDVYAEGNGRTALHVIRHGAERKVSYAELKERSCRVANHLRALGARRGDRLLAVLGNAPVVQELMLACLRLGLVFVPASTALTPALVRERIEKGGVRLVVADAAAAEALGAVPGVAVSLAVGDAVQGWLPFDRAYAAPAAFTADAETPASDPALLYFTSGTSASPKLVEHTHASYPVGHLSTLYWLGLREGDLHLNVSSPGWGKHAWSSVFAPLTAGAAVVLEDVARFQPAHLLDLLERLPVTSLCAPATAWRMVTMAGLAGRRVHLREALSAGEPVGADLIAAVRGAWGLTIREGYGQTETTAQIGYTPGQPVKPGAMGRPLPGFDVRLLDADGAEAEEGEITLGLDPVPTGLMAGYAGDAALTARAMRGGRYHTGDTARRDADGHLHYVGRADDLFKSSDYRISPFEIEAVMLGHGAIAEVAVIPSPDPVRGLVPKAFVHLRPSEVPSPELARDILKWARSRLPRFQRVRRIQFGELPKTISGKIRRGELRNAEQARPGEHRGAGEYWLEDLAEHRTGRGGEQP